jgi:ABC-type transport system involved in cytochrome c biogenesis ATPase subunit
LDLEGCQWLESKMVEFVQQGGSVIFTSHQATSLSIPPRILQLEQPQEWLC